MGHFPLLKKQTNSSGFFSTVGSIGRKVVPKTFRMCYRFHYFACYIRPYENDVGASMNILMFSMFLLLKYNRK